MTEDAPWLATTRQGKRKGNGIASGTSETACAACGANFTPTRRWAKFCSTRCRQVYHAKLTPEALRRDLDELRKRLEALEKAARG